MVMAIYYYLVFIYLLTDLSWSNTEIKSMQFIPSFPLLVASLTVIYLDCKLFGAERSFLKLPYLAGIPFAALSTLFKDQLLYQLLPDAVRTAKLHKTEITLMMNE